MKTIVRTLFIVLLVFNLSGYLFGQPRFFENINHDWNFKGFSYLGDSINEMVNLPHTWNSKDAQSGFEYYRGVGTYSKKLVIDKKYLGKRLFLKFEGVHTVSDVFLNGVHLGQHRGGYSAFAYEITSMAKVGEENTLFVKVDNLKHDDILPLGGDFNQYGGIYRPVQLLVMEPVCITPLDYASPGVYIKQAKVTDTEANLEITGKLSNGSVKDEAITILTSVFDKEGNVVAKQNSEVTIPAGKDVDGLQKITIVNPKLWNGTATPYLYKVKVQLFSEAKLIDEVVQSIGLRSFNVDPDKGFFLNNNHLALHGVSRHQDKKDRGSALSEEDHRIDIQLIKEMGVNSLRLAHYQQSDYFYSLCDSAGMVVWAEIPFVGSMIGGYSNTPQFDENAKQQLKELIRQNYNHPSICFWGVFNELSNPKTGSPTPLVKELVTLAKKEDPTRLITAASLLPDKDELNFQTDVMAWNKYFGWYYGTPDDLGKWTDQLHKKYPLLPIAISEYGAGASIRQHEYRPVKPFPMFHPWHPEEWQAQYHEQSWKIINERPYIWGTFVWNMFDFSADFRNEGDEAGMNDKGMVTYDRQTKKDAFYLYKVNWNPEPMVHLNDKRFKMHEEGVADVTVYSNLASVELFVNEKPLGSLTSNDKIFKWKAVKLTKGNNRIKAVGKGNDKTIVDQCVWIYPANGWIKPLIWFFRIGIIPFCVICIVSLPFLFIQSFKRKRTGWPKFGFRFLFFVIALIIIVLLVVNIITMQNGVNIFEYSIL